MSRINDLESRSWRSESHDGRKSFLNVMALKKITKTQERNKDKWLEKILYFLNSKQWSSITSLEPTTLGSKALLDFAVKTGIFQSFVHKERKTQEHCITWTANSGLTLSRWWFKSSSVWSSILESPSGKRTINMKDRRNTSRGVAQGRREPISSGSSPKLVNVLFLFFKSNNRNNTFTWIHTLST